MKNSSVVLINQSNITVDTTSPSHSIEHTLGFAIDLEMVGASGFRGQLVIQVSMDNSRFQDMGCIDISDITTDHFVNVGDCYYSFVKVKLVLITGTITSATIRLYQKGI